MRASAFALRASKSVKAEFIWLLPVSLDIRKSSIMLEIPTRAFDSIFCVIGLFEGRDELGCGGAEMCTFEASSFD
jgi:hypothetical protein